MSYIYKIVNDINDKIYIGKTDFPIEKRFQEHCRDAFRDKYQHRPLYSAMRKYGKEFFHIELVEETEFPEEREIYWIAFYNTYINGYNATFGGDGKHLYDHQAILAKLQTYPYACDVAKEFGCSKDIVYNIAKTHHISLKNKSQERFKTLKKQITALSKDGKFVQSFDSVAEAAKWCYDKGKCKTLNSGVRAHIAEAANGKRKSAYSYIWQYV